MPKPKNPVRTTESPTDPLLTPFPDATRREFVLGAIGGVAAAALVTACSDEKDEGAANSPDAGSDAGAQDAGGQEAGVDTAAAPDLADTGATGDVPQPFCTLYPEQTAGPFYLDLDMLRRDITEGMAGAPLSLVITVVSADACAPLRDVAVEVWQCDVAGVYSGFPGQLGGVDSTGETFMRGAQVTDDAGQVRFDTIYPGWYPGRTTHIHFRVHPSSTSEATSQLYFPEEVTAEVYETEPYADRGQKDTSNEADSVNRGEVPPLLAVVETGDGYEGSLTVAVAG